MTGRRRVLICNERFLARFGVDRILVLLAEHLADLGMEVSFACLRSDRAVLARISREVEEIVVPDGLAPGDADAFVSAHLRDRWREDAPDVVITGGWPFFGAAAAAEAMGLSSIFIDAGAVPHEGFPDFALPSQLELRRLRQRMLPEIGRILPISHFIHRSQTEFDRGSDRGIHTVLLGADHLKGRTFDVAEVSADERESLDRLEGLAAQGRRLLMALGRYESFGYKNSAAAFEVLRTLVERGHDAHLIVLAGSETVEAPAGLADRVTFLKTISDAALQATMQLSDIGLSLTRWEGFNLPLAEMQWLSKPVLAYNIGAHPEVIAEPWFLSEALPELIAKAAALLDGTEPAHLRDGAHIERFHRRFRWRDVLDRWTEFVLMPPRTPADPGHRLVLMDVSNSARDPANSGVVRVTRRLGAELQKLGEIDLAFVAWDPARHEYALLSPANLAFLSSNAGPMDWLGPAARTADQHASVDTLLQARDPRCAAPPVLFIPEVILDGTAGQRVEWARRHGLASACVFHDMLPIVHPDLVDPAIARVFPAYVDALRGVDAMWSNSGFSLSEFTRYNLDLGAPMEGAHEVVWLPGQFSDQPRSAAEPDPAAIEILCVSTVEPRKNHRTLVEAFLRLAGQRPDLPLKLVLVGNSYASSADLAKWLKGVVAEHSSIEWRGIISDAALAEHYRRTTFTVYPSLAEGFGLPIMESLWMGVPCLCHSGGVMAEQAAGGGCMTVDMSDVIALADAMEMMASDGALRAALARQAARRQIDTWRDYAGHISERLQSVGVRR
jgi:glycosyltransferase involved in cell wall biosynthesis